MADDPLDDIMTLPLETQVAVLVSVMRTTRSQLSRIEKKLDWVGRSIWALIATIVAGVAVYYLTIARTPAPAAPTKASTQTSTTTLPPFSVAARLKEKP